MSVMVTLQFYSIREFGEIIHCFQALTDLEWYPFLQFYLWIKDKYVIIFEIWNHLTM